MDFVQRSSLQTPVCTLPGATMTQAVISNGKGQDVVFLGHHVAIEGLEGDEDYDILAIFDGHGPMRDSENQFMVRLRTAPFADLLSDADPVAAVIGYFNTIQYGIQCGAVGLIVKVYKDRVQGWSVGDCKGLVFLDGELVHQTQGHCSRNVAEMERVAAHNPRYRREPGKTLSAISPTEVTMIDNEYIVYPVPLFGTVKLAPTQSFGHHNTTGYDPETFVIPFTRDQRVQVALMTDGVADVTAWSSAEDLAFLSTATAPMVAEFAENRWKQPWTHIHAGLPYPLQYFPRDQYDDIGCVVWSKEGDQTV